MSTFLDRLKEEQYELNEKVNNLEKFIETNPAFENVGEYQSEMLVIQLDTMRTYLSILVARINDLTNN